MSALAQDVAAGTLEERLASLREGGGRADPVRFRFIEALASRMEGQPEAVRALLARKLEEALAEFPLDAPRAIPSAPAATCAPLADLNTYLRSVSGADDAADAHAAHELASARRFRESWETLRTLERLEQALARSPANAGPLNSHALVVKSLRRMGDASTGYTRRFMAYAETLLWLEAARPLLKPVAKAKPGRKSQPARKSR